MLTKASQTLLILSFAAVLSVPLLEGTPKRTLAGNMKLTYTVTPPVVDDWRDLFGEGLFYGRIRTNFFHYDWDSELAGSRKDNGAMGVGGSIVFKSATWEGLSFMAGVYGTSSPFYRMDREDIGLLKSGKDVLSRYEVSTGGSYHFVVLGQATVNYAFADNHLRAGRQIFESVFTASNDTKMVPNTFDGITLVNTALEGTVLRAAWFGRQKLRDHTDSHDVITFRNAEGESWANNDDSAVHKGLSYANFRAAGEDTDHDLLILTGKTALGVATTLEASGLLVPDVLANFTLELNQNWTLGEWGFRPGLRLMTQFDEGGGAIGGASLNGNVSNPQPRGYTNPDSLDARLIGIRGVFEHPEKVLRVQLGFTRVSDKADLVTPWRGFPTGGYTRAMGQYNWRADTDSYMLQVNVDYDRLE
jgi:hypothetical protein